MIKKLGQDKHDAITMKDIGQDKHNAITTKYDCKCTCGRVHQKLSMNVRKFHTRKATDKENESIVNYNYKAQ